MHALEPCAPASVRSRPGSRGPARCIGRGLDCASSFTTRWRATSMTSVTRPSPAPAPAAPLRHAPRSIAAASTHAPLTMSQVVVGDERDADASAHDVTQLLVTVFDSLQTGCKMIADQVARASIDGLYGYAALQDAAAHGERDAPKKLDVLANEVLKQVLADSGVVGLMASEEDEGPVVVRSSAQQGQHKQGELELVVVFDPLDGSRNIEVSIPTGTIFGIYSRSRLSAPDAGSDATSEVLQPGTRLLAAGYALYSSATMMVISVGRGVQGFTLDRTTGEFVLTHPDMRIPERGQIYSLNDARYHDWPAGLQRYIDDIRQGRGQNPKQYSSRYVCSLVADFHRTLIYGGWAGNPREHLRLVYEANPLAFLAEQAGGSGSDGQRRILDITPSALHQRLPLFLGSKLDIQELESYGDVQQLSGKKYDV